MDGGKQPEARHYRGEPARERYMLECLPVAAQRLPIEGDSGGHQDSQISEQASSFSPRNHVVLLLGPGLLRGLTLASLVFIVIILVVVRCLVP